MRVDAGCIDGSGRPKDLFWTKNKRNTLKDTAVQRNDAGSTLVAGLLQVRPKGATQVAPVFMRRIRPRTITLLSVAHGIFMLTILFFSNKSPSISSKGYSLSF